MNRTWSFLFALWALLHHTTAFSNKKSNSVKNSYTNGDDNGTDAFVVSQQDGNSSNPDTSDTTTTESKEATRTMIKPQGTSQVPQQRQQQQQQRRRRLQAPTSTRTVIATSETLLEIRPTDTFMDKPVSAMFAFQSENLVQQYLSLEGHEIVAVSVRVAQQTLGTADGSGFGTVAGDSTVVVGIQTTIQTKSDSETDLDLMVLNELLRLVFEVERHRFLLVLQDSDHYFAPIRSIRPLLQTNAGMATGESGTGNQGTDTDSTPEQTPGSHPFYRFITTFLVLSLGAFVVALSHLLPYRDQDGSLE